MPLSGYFSVCGTRSPLLLASFCCQGPFLHNLSWIFFIWFEPSMSTVVLFSLYTPSFCSCTQLTTLTHNLYSCFLTWTIPSSSQFMPTGPPALHALTVCNPSAFFLLNDCLHLCIISCTRPPLFSVPADDLVSCMLRMKAERKHFLAILHFCSHLLHLLFLLSPLLMFLSLVKNTNCSTLLSHPACISLSYFYWVTLIICRWC